MTYYLYILECRDKSLYTGIATDVTRRFAEHASGKGARYTRGRKVRKIAHVERLGSRSEALKREAEVKRLSRKEKIKLIRKMPYSQSPS